MAAATVSQTYIDALREERAYLNANRADIDLDMARGLLANCREASPAGSKATLARGWSSEMRDHFKAGVDFWTLQVRKMESK